MRKHLAWALFSVLLGGSCLVALWTKYSFDAAFFGLLAVINAVAADRHWTFRKR